MARKSKGKFDMKGHTLPGIKQVKGEMGDGRASSSPFQIKPTGDSPAQFSPFGGFGGGRPMWKSILDPAGFFGKGNQNQGNAPVQQPGQSFAKANFEQLQQQPNPNADPNIVPPPTTVAAAAPVAGGPATPQPAPVVDPNSAMAMKSPVKDKIPEFVKEHTATNYKKAKSTSKPNEKTINKYDEHNIHAEEENPTDGGWCAVCGDAREDHDATHSFKANYND